MNDRTCRAINYTTTTNYELINRDCNEKLGFSCRPNSASTSNYYTFYYCWEVMVMMMAMLVVVVVDDCCF